MELPGKEKRTAKEVVEVRLNKHLIIVTDDAGDSKRQVTGTAESCICYKKPVKLW